MSQTISIQAVCERLGKPRQLIHYWIGNGRIPKDSVYLVPIKKMRIEIDTKIVAQLEKELKQKQI